jgi:hypothetical protein
MKFNWGTGIVIGGALVSTFVGVMAYKSVQLRFDLVSDDYYDQELKYQSQIQRINNSADLEENPVVAFDQVGKIIEIKFPANTKNETTGVVELYKPDDARADRKFNLLIDSDNVQKIATSGFPAGAWDVKITWMYDSKEYYLQNRIYIYN